MLRFCQNGWVIRILIALSSRFVFLNRIQTPSPHVTFDGGFTPKGPKSHPRLLFSLVRFTLFLQRDNSAKCSIQHCICKTDHFAERYIQYNFMLSSVSIIVTKALVSVEIKAPRYLNLFTVLRETTVTLLSCEYGVSCENDNAWKLEREGSHENLQGLSSRRTSGIEKALPSKRRRWSSLGDFKQGCFRPTAEETELEWHSSFGTQWK